MIKDIYKYEEELASQGYKYICGCDEAGRGPMAGPLVAASVILPIGYKLDSLDDSKKLTKKVREKLFDIIYKDAIEVQVEVISVNDVDNLNVYKASKIAMTNCVKRFINKADYCLTDCMPLDIDIPVLSLVKGDSKSASIAAASVIAKVTRDKIMDELDKIYPMYGFKKHKGYVTKFHLEMLDKYGVSEVHRKSFAPVRKRLNEQMKLF